MPRRKFIDKKSSTTYALVHRAQNDPLIHDEDAPSMVLAEKPPPTARRLREDDHAYSSAASVTSSHAESTSNRTGKKRRERGDLEEEFGLSVRRNEGEAAEHGVFFDDSEYDYMQHMRDLGSGEGRGAVTWVEASGPRRNGNLKGKGRLEDALRSLDLGVGEEREEGEDTRSMGTVSTTASTRSSFFPEDMFGSEFVRRRTYQDQQDIPDEIAGLQPDMDPALREVLEALDDEAYVDDEDDEDFFAQLTGGGEEVEKEEWERMAEQGVWMEDEGWESEDTVRAASPPPPLSANSPREPLPALDIQDGAEQIPLPPPEDVQAVPPADPTDGAWLDEFKKFQSAATSTSTSHHPQPQPPAAAGAAKAPSTLHSTPLSSSLATGPKKKRKGAKTSTTNYSMTSSALARTDAQTLLDSRFDRLEAAYEVAEEEEEEQDLDPSFDDTSTAGSLSQASYASRSSFASVGDAGAPRVPRGDFDRIMDEFLSGGGGSGGNRKGGRKRGDRDGMQQLDEVRRGLGPAWVKKSGVAASSSSALA